MRSKYPDKFNHDRDAVTYDSDVLDSTHPFREGYEACLNWVAAHAVVDPACRVLDLGTGTGNLAHRLPRCKQLVCVDISTEMTRRAAEKLGHRNEVDFVIADLLEYFDTAPVFDRIVSTYAIHHLTDDEKAMLFKKIHADLTNGGRLVVGDLMFESAAAKIQICRQLSDDLVSELEEEFFWKLDVSIPALQQLGFHVETQSFSPVSWGITATK